MDMHIYFTLIVIFIDFINITISETDTRYEPITK